MPTSHWRQLNEVMDFVMSIKPESVLDVGVGFGKYGVLIREYLELWDGRGIYDQWKVRLDGVEIFKSYHNPIYDYIYSHTYFGDALDVIPNLQTYDLVLLIDVLEHFTKSDGCTLLDLCFAHGKKVIISTPLYDSRQKSAFGNPHEEHKTYWSKSDLLTYCNPTFIDNTQSILCCAVRRNV